MGSEVTEPDPGEATEVKVDTDGGDAEVNVEPSGDGADSGSSEGEGSGEGSGEGNGSDG